MRRLPGADLARLELYMSDEATEIRVNFGRPMPVFPLASVTLMPHAVLPVHIFEPRYRQMVAEALDGPGQIAMAVFEGERGAEECHGQPPVRPAVCVGQIVQHQKLPDGRHNVALHGVCRAKILQELPPDGERPYRLALLEPVGLSDGDETVLQLARERLVEALDSAPLADLRAAEEIVKLLRRDEEPVPMSAVLELVTVSLLRDAENKYYNELHYRLLAEGDVAMRAATIENELASLAALLRRAEPQRRQEAPKGVSWN